MAYWVIQGNECVEDCEMTVVDLDDHEKCEECCLFCALCHGFILTSLHQHLPIFFVDAVCTWDYQCTIL